MPRRHLRLLKPYVCQGVNLEYIDGETLAYATSHLKNERETYLQNDQITPW